MTVPIRVAVVDDHELFRSGLIELLESTADISVVAEGATGRDAIALAGEYSPNVILLDVEMPGPGAAATIRKITEISAATRVVILTMHDDPDLVRELLEAGAAGYLVKSAGRTELVAAITAAHRDASSVLLAVSRRTAAAFTRRIDQEKTHSLSPREVEVLGLLSSALSNHEIAQALYISDATVKRHLANIYAKLGASSRIDAARRAVHLGIVVEPFSEADKPSSGDESD